jgi:hypothetical protein
VPGVVAFCRMTIPARMIAAIAGIERMATPK